jgi:hypothetical protein
MIWNPLQQIGRFLQQILNQEEIGVYAIYIFYLDYLDLMSQEPLLLFTTY